MIAPDRRAAGEPIVDEALQGVTDAAWTIAPELVMVGVATLLVLLGSFLPMGTESERHAAGPAVRHHFCACARRAAGVADWYGARRCRPSRSPTRLSSAIRWPASSSRPACSSGWCYWFSSGSGSTKSTRPSTWPACCSSSPG